MRLYLIWFALLALALAPWARSQDRAELEVDHALTLEFPTPHTDWAQPYVGGKTRVLFILSGQGTLPRECVELKQRFDLEAEAVFWARITDSDEEHWHGGQVGEQRLLDLLQQPWDCVVLIEQSLTKLAAEPQYRLLEPVTKGAGIVIIKERDDRILKPAQRLAPQPAWLETVPDAEAYRVGKGRGVFLPARPDIPYNDGWETEYDAWAERFGRAILWAAGKEPQVTLKLDLDKATLHWADWAVALRVSAAGTLPEGTLELHTRLRRSNGDTEGLPTRLWTAGEEVRYRLPGLAADQWCADAWLLHRGQVVTWTSLPFTVDSSRRVKAVRLDQAWAEIGGTLSGTVELEGQPLPGEALSVRLLDRRQRILAQADGMTGGPRSGEFSFPVREWFPMLLTVEARIVAAGQEVHRTTVHANVTQRRRGQFNFLMWDMPQGTLAPYAEASLAKHGVTLQLSHGNPPLLAAAFDVAWVPYTTRIQAKLGKDGVMAPFCWNDEQAVKRHLDEKAAEYARARQHGVFAWSLGDEVDTQGYCASPHCVAAYREYLRSQYPELASLNAAWGAQFTDWSQVAIADPADLDEAAALKAGNTARWFDRQAFKSWNFVRFCGRYRTAYEAIDPQAKVGFEGAGLFDRGDDIDLIVRSNTFWSPYPGTTDEVIRSIAPRDFPRANWMGYTKDADSLLAKYWRMVTLGMDSVWWWRWDCIGRFHGWLAPDLRPFPAVADILQDTQVVRDGLGDLLLRSTRLDDGIAILYSYPSSLLHKQRGGASYGGYEAAHLGAQTLVRELGLEFRYLTDRMVREGELAKPSIRVLLLPRAEVLADAEVDAIREFVALGGLVLADVRTGVYDGHCRRRPQGALDDLFGIRREGCPEATVVPSTDLGALKLDAGVKASSGAAANEFTGVPAFITHTAGQGETLFLNADFSAFSQMGLPGTPESVATDLALRLARFKVIPELTLVGRGQRRERGVMISRWQDGNASLFSLFRTGGERTTVQVLLPRDAAVYDLRQRRLISTGTAFTTEIRPNRASFFAVLPAKAPTARLELNCATAGQGSTAGVTLRVPGAAGLHALRLRVQAEGKHLDWLDRNVIVGAEPVTFPLPIAFNDPVGRYDIRATDLFTGKTVEASLEVR
jgi:hypothetical protein